MVKKVKDLPIRNDKWSEVTDIYQYNDKKRLITNTLDHPVAVVSSMDEPSSEDTSGLLLNKAGELGSVLNIPEMMFKKKLFIRSLEKDKPVNTNVSFISNVEKAKTRTVRVFDGVSQTTTLAYTAGDVITLDVFPYVSNAGLPTGCPALTANKLERVSFTATDSGVIGNKGTTYFYGALFRVQINNDVYPMTSAKSYELAEGASLGAELWTHGDITANAQTGGFVGSKSVNLPTNTPYVFSGTITNLVSGSCRPYNVGTVANINTEGEFNIAATTAIAGNVGFIVTYNPTMLTINNVSIKQLPTKHFQYVNSPAAITLTQDSVTGEWLGTKELWTFGSSVFGSTTTAYQVLTGWDSVLDKNRTFKYSSEYSITQGTARFRLGTNLPVNEDIVTGNGVFSGIASSDATTARMSWQSITVPCSGTFTNTSVKQLFQLSTFMQAKYREDQLMAKWEAEKHQPRYFFEGDGATRYIPLPSAITLTGDFEIEMDFYVNNVSSIITAAMLFGDSSTANNCSWITSDGRINIRDTNNNTITSSANTVISNVLNKIRFSCKNNILTILLNDVTIVSGVFTAIAVSFFGKRKTEFFFNGTISNVKIHDRGTLVYASRLNRNDGLAINEIGLGDNVTVGTMPVTTGTDLTFSYGGNILTVSRNNDIYWKQPSWSISLNQGEQLLIEFDYGELPLQGNSACFVADSSNVMKAQYKSNVYSGRVSQVFTANTTDVFKIGFGVSDFGNATAVFSNISIRKAPLSAAIVNPEVSPQLYNHISGTYNGWTGKELVQNGFILTGLSYSTSQNSFKLLSDNIGSYTTVTPLLSTGYTYLAEYGITINAGSLAVVSSGDTLIETQQTGAYKINWTGGYKFKRYSGSGLNDIDVYNISIKRFIKEI